MAFVLGANLLFVGLLIALSGTRAPASEVEGFDGGGPGSSAVVGADGIPWSVYKLARTSPAIMKAKYFKLDEGKYCSFLNSDASRSLIYKRCVCRAGFFGVDCGIPQSLWSQLLRNGTAPMKIARLQEPRRVIEFKYHAVPTSSSAFVSSAPIGSASSSVDNSTTGLGQSLVQNSTVCHNATVLNATSEGFGFRHELPDLQVYTGPVQANFTCGAPRIAAFSCPALLCCWNRFWTQASELSFTDLVVLDIGEPTIGSVLPGELLDFFKFYQGFNGNLMIRRGPAISVVATFNAVAVECNFDFKCIASCESSTFQVIDLDL